MSERVAVREVSKTYRLGQVTVTALEGVSLAVKAVETSSTTWLRVYGIACTCCAPTRMATCRSA